MRPADQLQPAHSGTDPGAHLPARSSNDAHQRHRRAILKSFASNAIPPRGSPASQRGLGHFLPPVASRRRRRRQKVAGRPAGESGRQFDSKVENKILPRARHIVARCSPRAARGRRVSDFLLPPAAAPPPCHKQRRRRRRRDSKRRLGRRRREICLTHGGGGACLLAGRHRPASKQWGPAPPRRPANKLARPFRPPQRCRRLSLILPDTSAPPPAGWPGGHSSARGRCWGRDGANRGARPRARCAPLGPLRLNKVGARSLGRPSRWRLIEIVARPSSGSHDKYT